VNSEFSSIDAWLRGGGLVVTASERAARSLTKAYHRARRAEGLTAWPAPDIRDWRVFVRNAWSERGFDSRLVLNSLQEQSLWSAIAASRPSDASSLAGARERLAALAMDAHELLCSYSPSFLKTKARSAWDRDAAVFSDWLAAFDERCRVENAISAARLPLEIIPALGTDSAARPPILLAGFDRILPTQRQLLDAWGDWTQASLAEPAPQIEFLQATDPASELAACALWCKHCLAANPGASLLVVTHDVPTRRGEIERAFLRYASADEDRAEAPPLFEFSLGVALTKVPLVRGAQLLLRWLDGPIAENELDWLLSTGQLASSPEESLALTAFMRALRNRGLERTQWTLADFLRKKPKLELPAAWATHIRLAQRQLQDAAIREQSPVAWSELAPRLLELAGWPGHRSLTSAEFQAHRRWLEVLDECASLGFDGRRIAWKEFFATLDRATAETLFAPESQDASILIAGPAETAGLAADAVWFLGAGEDAWPSRGTTQPLLPLAVQRQAGMPHASAALDWEVAAAMTRRLLASATEVHFSFPRQSEGVEARPSRLILQVAGPPQSLPPERCTLFAPPDLTILFEDSTRVPFPPGSAPGGAATLTAQSQCAFKAFAAARLGAQSWDHAEAGLNRKERGNLLHEVLHSVWAGTPDGIRSHAELVALPDLPAFVAAHVRRALQASMPVRARESMPPRYLALEESRLVTLVTEWLRYEATRVPFSVLETEQKSDAALAGLQFHLRLDRIDKLIDQSLLVIDYKSGNASPNDWNPPRPNDVQLPLYAGFAVPPDAGEIGGLVFAKVRPGESTFAGLVRNAKATLLSKISGNSNLVRRPLSPEQISEWKRQIEQLAIDFLSGRAAVDPRDYPKTCEYCGLQALCRVQEHPPQTEDEEAGDA
jgi:ATP-dependent helicase/nuclease subunit B